MRTKYIGDHILCCLRCDVQRIMYSVYPSPCSRLRPLLVVFEQQRFIYLVRYIGFFKDGIKCMTYSMPPDLVYNPKEDMSVFSSKLMRGGAMREINVGVPVVLGKIFQPHSRCWSMKPYILITPIPTWPILYYITRSSISPFVMEACHHPHLPRIGWGSLYCTMQFLSAWWIVVWHLLFCFVCWM